MKNVLGLAIIIFFFTNIIVAQKTGRSTLIGIKLGITYTKMNFNKGYPTPAVHISSTWKTGALAGMMLQIKLADKLFLQPEYIFSTASSKRNDSATTYHFTYLSFPLLLKYNLVTGLYILGGAQFDLLLKAKKKAGSREDITHDTEERNIGITAGIEYLLKQNFSLSARYIHGLNHIGIGQRSNVQEYKSRQVMFTAGFYF